ncbi:MAG TPA: hypothetical protein VF736_13030 [Pyrinomonadaceae bacterium]
MLCASLLCCAAASAGVGASGSAFAGARGAQAAAAAYTATVKRDEARFTFPAPQRAVWRWRRSETKERAREYEMSVRVKNGGQEYSFGYYLWKFPGATERRGGLSELIDAGQESLFERSTPGRMTVIRDAGVEVRHDGERVIITVKGRKNVERLFSARPAEVTFETVVPEATPVSQAVPVTYEN